MTVKAEIQYPTFRHWADINPMLYEALSVDVWCHDRFGLPWAISNPEGIWAIIPSPKNRTLGARAVRVNFINERDYLLFLLKWGG